MNCPRCGNELRDDDLFCGKCGWSRKNIFYRTKTAIAKFYKKILCVFAIIIVLALLLFVGKVIYENVTDSIDNSEFRKSVLDAKVVTDYNVETFAEDMDSVEFGKYIQKSDKKYDEENEEENEEETSIENIEEKTTSNESVENEQVKEEIEKDKIKWIILEKDEKNHRALLLSKYILDMHGFNENRNDFSWETSEIRHWLNNDFYNQVFDESEKRKICEVELESIVDYGRDIKDKRKTNDKVFLLSLEEMKKYFSFTRENQYGVIFGKNATAKETDYAKHATFGYPSKAKNRFATFGLNTDKEITATWAIGNNGYWLRSPISAENKGVVYMNALGRIYYYGLYPDVHALGLRPAVWVSYK